VPAPYLVNTGKGNAGLGVKVFFIWGGCCLSCFAFTYFFIPETRGLSLEQIDVLYINSTPRTSVAYRNKLFAENVRPSHALAATAEKRDHDVASVEKA
jgi:SP family sugar:H+ symporter-like MFS transporter